MKRLLFVAAAGALLLGGASAHALRLPGAPKCPIFPATNAWNQRVDALPVAENSAQMIQSIGLGTGLHPDFGSGLYNGQPIGIPYDVVSKRTKRSRATFTYADESDKGPYPIPTSVHIEGGRASTGDRHALLIDKDACKLYELGALYPKGGGWNAGAGAIWNLRLNALRPAGWTSADAAGLPIFPGLARYDEVARGVINHALRFTAARTRRQYVYPARHYASSSDDPALPPMGLRVRLKASVDISSFPKQSRIVLQALKTYGMLLADNGSNWYISGAPNPKWSNDDLHSLGRITGSMFEVVDTSSLHKP
jgi:opacity protein-like surface antigen